MQAKARMYIDGRGWKYKVMPGIGGDCFKVGYQKPEKKGDTGWHRSTKQAFPWRETPEESREDLDLYAKRHGWKESR